LDCVSDLIYFWDIVVQFRTGYLEQGLMVLESKKLAHHYINSVEFILDSISLMPLDFFLLSKFQRQPLFRFFRFFKIHRALRFYYVVESRTVFPNLWRVINLTHILLILAHWFGCFYYLLSEAEDFKVSFLKYLFRFVLFKYTLEGDFLFFKGRLGLSSKAW
jgi:hypothetical protein